MYSATVLDVLIASPSDTVAQREVIRNAVIDWNASNTRVFGVVLLPVMWETHSLPGLGGRPQGMINEQLVNDADILIATFWTRLGSPTGEADSGTVEEINRFRTNGRPVHLYFCDGPVALLGIDASQVEAIQRYREEVSQAGLFSSYSTNDELRIKVRDDLTKRIHEMQEAGLVGRPDSTRTVHISDSDHVHADETEYVNQLDAIRQGLQGYLASWEAQYQSLDDYSVDSRHDLMRDVSVVLFEAIRQVATINPGAPILAQIQEIATAANNWSTFRTYIDGGVTFSQLSDGCRQVLDQLQQVIREEWN
jgi:hypothetical protein